MNEKKLKKILSDVQTPGRYTGGEYNRYTTRPEKYSFLLTYPDDYKIGMSSLGYHTVGKIVDLHPDFSVQRCFAPAPDMENKMREEGIALFSLESKRKASEFDIIGFSVHNELSFTNIVNMLDMAGINPMRRKRKGAPLIIAGGPAVVNPAILAEFMDLMVVGEAEAVLPSLLDIYSRGDKREVFLEKVSSLEGVFVPGRTESVTLRPFKDFSDCFFPFDHPVPGISIPHNRINVEISRGCKAACRFCQASVIYAPYREKKSKSVVEIASKCIASNGGDEVALTSLSATDHCRILDIMDDMHYAFRDLGVSVVMPSLRPEKFNSQFASRLSRMRKGGITFAPETPSARLKKIINKNIDNDTIVQAACVASKAGWRKLKLYFMIGLPGEELSDIEEIGSFADRIKKETNIKNITVSLSAFTPQPHTPFQWVVPDSPELLLKKESIIKRKARGATVKGIDARRHIISSVLCRGDASLARVVVNACKEGARFDQWGEHFSFRAWEKAFEKSGLDCMDYYYRDLDLDDNMPWDAVKTHRGKEYLRKSYMAVSDLIGEKKDG